jgi:hypothetical protein
MDGYMDAQSMFRPQSDSLSSLERFYLANAVLVGFVTFHLIKLSCNRSGICVFQAVLVSLLFVFSWRHHQALFWYSSINELLQSFFRLISLVLVLHFLEVNGKQLGFLMLSAGGYALALLSKESAISFLPEVILFSVYSTLCRQPYGRVNVRRVFTIIIPFSFITALWGSFYITTSSIDSSTVHRGGLQILQTSVLNWILRFLQFFHGNYYGTGFISRSTTLMLVEFIGLLSLAFVALAQERYLWILSLAWVFLAVTPYVAVVSNQAMDLQLPVALLGVAGSRFLYYSAAGASLFLVLSAQWVLEEIENWTGSEKRRWISRLISTSFVIYFGINAARLIRFEAQWDTAGKIGKSIVQQVITEVPTPKQNSLLCLANLPDNYKGKYVFRNGIEEALYLAYERDDFDIKVTTQDSPFANKQTLDKEGCSHIFYFDEKTKRLVRN